MTNKDLDNCRLSPACLLYERITRDCRGDRGLSATAPKDRQSYYVWSMARFLRGDTHRLPIKAIKGIKGDRFKDQFDFMADRLVRELDQVKSKKAIKQVKSFFTVRYANM